jgi:hypothetical protein
MSTQTTDPAADLESPCASVSRAPLTCRQALAALLHQMALRTASSSTYPTDAYKQARADAYRALGEVGQ